jgi:hypothetical protein
MSSDFIVFKRGGNVPERTLDRGKMLERVDLYLSKADKARLWRRDRIPGMFRPEERVRERLAAVTRDAPEGQRILVQRQGEDETLVVQKVEPLGTVTDLGCNPQIEKAHSLLWAKFGEDKLRSAGRWYCRYIDGTKTVSRHGYRSKDWQGAAEDIFGEGGMNTMAGLEDIAKFLVRKHEAGEVKLYTVIYGNRKWRAGEGWGVYGGVFHTHVHYDALRGRPCTP